jgi:YesN/AraC family two-component response regulator
MAHWLGIGRTMLSQHINTNEAMNFNAWINHLRIEEAKQLMRQHPDYTFLQISELVGYSEQANFSRQFKIHAGKSPSVWRQKYVKPVLS